MATSAGIFPAAQASAMAARFDPLPEPSTPTRTFLTRFTAFYYRRRGATARAENGYRISDVNSLVANMGPVSLEILASEVLEISPVVRQERLLPRVTPRYLGAIVL